MDIKRSHNWHSHAASANQIIASRPDAVKGSWGQGIGDRGLETGDRRLGIGDWEVTSARSPIPNP
ncbi:MAG: hypothetical protein DWI57_07355 [Chloroflexi bacterium]|nr:MAG: hypothetical protein DWI57_07355 [Chloroflexota bacterium]